MKRSASAWQWVSSCVAVLATACAPRPPLANATQSDVPSLTLRRLDGSSVRLEEFRGQVVLLDVWATWCEPCRRSLPFYEELYRSLSSRGFVVLAVSIDETDAAVRSFLGPTPPSFPVLRDPRGEAPRALGAAAMPTSYLIDRTGKVRWEHGGFQRGDEELVRQQVLAQLGEDGAPRSEIRR